jgi:phage terminase large subunit-like protein
MTKPGPKAEITAGPLSMRGLPKSGSDRVIRFIQRHLVVPKGHGAGKPVRLRPWQKDIIRRLYDPTPRPRAGLVSIPRGNSKTTTAAMLAVYHLFAEEVASPQVLFVASDERQAGIGLNIARRMIELDERLAERCHIYKDRIVVPHSDGMLRALPSEAAALQGYDPTFTVVDELHVVTADVWEAVTLAAGKRPESLTLAISTPAGDRDGVMWSLVEHGRQADDPSFVLVEYGAPEGCALDDEKAWHLANPALGDFLSIDALRATMRTTREAQFRRYRLGQWSGDSDDAWMDAAAWQACALNVEIEDGTEVVLAFDGSASGDSTALVASTIEEIPHLFVIGVWENPGDPRWRVPRAEVMDTIREAFDRYSVVSFNADPWGWRSELETLAEEFPGRIVQWPTNQVSRMAPATDRFYAAVTTGTLTHDAHPRLTSHITNAIAKSTAAGDVIVKDPRHGRKRKIDLAVAAITAIERSAYYLNNAPRSIGVIAV